MSLGGEILTAIVILIFLYAFVTLEDPAQVAFPRLWRRVKRFFIKS